MALTPKEKTLRRACSALNLLTSVVPFPLFHWDKIRFHPESIEILEAFEMLGGKGIPKFSFSINEAFYFNGFYLVLDDVSSFNQFRKSTLKLSLYDEKMPFSSKANYLKYCRVRENECLKSARTKLEWSNAELDAVYGESDLLGQLYDKGASVWKQRAFNDFVLDCFSLFFQIKIVRIAVWDEIFINGKITPLNDFIAHPSEDEFLAIVKLLKKRLQQADIMKADLF